MKYIVILLPLLMSQLAFANYIPKSVEDFCSESNLNEINYLKSKKTRFRSPRTKNKTRFYYKGCPPDISWLKEARSILCKKGNVKDFSVSELKEVQLPEFLIFNLGGASDFNAKELAETLSPVNLKGDEGKDLAGKNWSGKLLEYVLKYSLEIREKSELYMYSGSGYHSSQNSSSARECLKDTYDYLKTITELMQSPEKFPRYVLMGYSNGGAMAAKIQSEVGEEGYSIDLVFTIDPIVQTTKYLFVNKDEPIAVKHPNTKKLINLYQNNDFGSFPILKLRGRPIQDADQNILVTESTPGSILGSGEKNHIWIVRSPLAVKLLIDELYELRGIKNYLPILYSEFVNMDDILYFFGEEYDEAEREFWSQYIPLTQLWDNQ